ncbi:MAG: hypothetical protein ACK56F_24000 [bacterium]
MGLESTSILSDRIFEYLAGPDHQVDFKEYLKYLDTSMNGSFEQKQNIQFRMIDTQNKGFFEFEDLYQLIRQMAQMWSLITGNQLSKFGLS